MGFAHLRTTSCNTVVSGGGGGGSRLALGLRALGRGSVDISIGACRIFKKRNDPNSLCCIPTSGACFVLGSGTCNPFFDSLSGAGI